MNEFYQTVMGRRFFDAQLPNLIEAVNRLADAVEESNMIRSKELEKNADSKTEKQEEYILR